MFTCLSLRWEFIFSSKLCLGSAAKKNSKRLLCFFYSENIFYAAFWKRRKSSSREQPSKSNEPASEQASELRRYAAFGWQVWWWRARARCKIIWRTWSRFSSSLNFLRPCFDEPEKIFKAAPCQESIEAWPGKASWVRFPHFFYFEGKSWNPFVPE